VRSRLSILSLTIFMVFLQNASALSFHEFRIPTYAWSGAITTGPDGALWFLDSGGNRVRRVTTAGVFTDYAIPTANSGGFRSIVAGADGALWFTESNVNKIGRITTAGAVTEFPVPTPSSVPTSITRGADGNVWFTENATNKIARLTPDGVFTEFPLPTDVGHPGTIILGSDNNLWLTGVSAIVRMTMTGAATVFPLSSPFNADAIASGPDGNLWFVEQSGNKIGRISTLGALTEFPFPGSMDFVWNLAFGSDNNLYFVESVQNKIVRMTPGGAFTEYDVPSANASPMFLTRGPDGNIWFTETSVNKVAVLLIGTMGARGILPAVASTQGALGSFFRTAVQLHNPGPAAIAGEIIFHPAGVPGADSDPSLAYSLNPGETKNIPDLLPAMGRSGLGSADVVSESQGLPTVVARVFNDAGANGTSGFAEDMLAADDALVSGDEFALLVPADLARFRLNIGVRTLGSGATITVTQRNAGGSEVRALTKTYSGTLFEQTDAASFLGGPATANDSIRIHVDSGSLFVYGATTDNTTQDPSIQLSRK
jgi:streptogramin lyase